MISFSRLLLNIWMVFFLTQLLAQKEDHQWLFGCTGATPPFYDINGNPDTTFGVTVMDFNYDPPVLRTSLYLLPRFSGCNASVCNSDGQVLCYTNGMQIYSGRAGYIIEDTIAYGQYWEDSKGKDNDGNMISYGSVFVDASLILPAPERENIYYVFYTLWDNTPLSIYDIHARYLYCAEVDMDPAFGLGRLIYKDRVLVSDSLFIQDSLAISGLAACRHANGRDWWLVMPAKYQNRYYTFLMDPSGIHLKGVQESGERAAMEVGQVSFSPDGKRLAANSLVNTSNDGSKVIFFDFDRRNGKLTNPRSQRFQAGYGVSNGLAFSPDSRYVYVSNDQYIYQYDFYNPDVIGSRTTVATYDWYLYIYPGTSVGFPVSLGWMGLAPDGRIYVSAGSGSNRKMGVIHYPNERWEKCDVRQHSLHITTNYFRTMPNYPNYRLGPWDGSYCDTLGLDNNPIAKFRYEQDTMDYLKVRFTDLSYFRPESWHWDFGDGTTITGTTAIERYPYHTFPHNGTYEVCLTVSNENSSNTACRTLTFGTASTTTTEVKDIDVNLYPNPVKDQLNLTIYDYLPQKGMIQMFDARGNKVLSTRVYHGWNNVDMTRLLPGVYVYNIVDKGVVLKSGKVVKGE